MPWGFAAGPVVPAPSVLPDTALAASEHRPSSGDDDASATAHVAGGSLTDMVCFVRDGFHNLTPHLVFQLNIYEKQLLAAPASRSDNYIMIDHRTD